MIEESVFEEYIFLWPPNINNATVNIYCKFVGNDYFVSKVLILRLGNAYLLSINRYYKNRISLGIKITFYFLEFIIKVPFLRMLPVR